MERIFEEKEIGEVVGEFLDYLTQPLLEKERSKEGGGAVHSSAAALVLGFSGNLGAGKTTFTKEILRQLGFTGNAVSPTFVLRRDYDVGEKKLIHIDAYRLETPEQIFQVIGKDELADEKNIVIVEWPEKVSPRPGLGEEIFDKIFLFEHIDEKKRKISDK